MQEHRFGLHWIVKLTFTLGLLGVVAMMWQPSVRGISANFTQDPAQLEFFEKKIRPVLAANCQKCHNTKAQVAELDLSTAEGFAKGGESGALVNKDKPEESRLLKVISYDETTKMPPSGKLKAEEIADLTAWVKMGAPWPGVAVAAAKTWPKNSSARSFTEDEKSWWAFQPIKDVTAPAVKNSAWVKSPIDAFVLARLEEKNLKPAPAADKPTLLRRATFDLTGLPPTPNEMKAFLADNSPDAFKKVVERLLASPRYGEKWGRHWLDVARYADSTGNDEDHRYPHAWKYRDYVIKAYNDDMPYDQFVREQLAGDLLPSPDGGEVNRRGIIATGFLALGAKAIAQQDKMKMLYDVYDEQVDVTSKAFLGLTMACARCHNHKFDPILTKDYYALTGIFANTKSFSNAESHVSVPLEKPLVPKAEFTKYTNARQELAKQEKRVRLALEEITDAIKEPLVKQNSARLAEYMLAARKVYQDGAKVEDVARQTNLPENLLNKWVNYLKPRDTVRGYLNEWDQAQPSQRNEVAQTYQARFQKRFDEWTEKVSKWRPGYQKAISENTALPEKPKFEAGDDRFFNDVYFGGGPFVVLDKEQKNFTPEQWTQVNKLHKEIERLKKAAPPEPEMACAIEDGSLVKQTVFIRGDYNNHGEEAPPAFPAILSNYDTKPNFSGSGRLQFAEWLTRPEHPLTSRVMVNRLWQGHFGEGIVRTPDNFGKMGEKPTHPELLDFLARQFVKNGYSIKAMHRLMMLSSTYQMASDNSAAFEADPDNRLLSRFNRRRLSVEELRDGILAIDGTIDLTMGGSLQTGRGTDGETSQGRLSVNPETLKRRSIYIPLRRANLPTLLNLFDFGDATTMTGKRSLTNVATQALFWLNSDFLTNASKTITQQLSAKSPDDPARRVAIAYSQILNREAAPDEITMALKYIEGFKPKMPGEKTDEAAWQSFCRVLLSSNEFLYLD
ncbi:MAG: PSD1 domain-containing protein [Acidobacteria bacterium]|nr:PSD1 domain-containing protein [Acidobacteriota bacterium]